MFNITVKNTDGEWESKDVTELEYRLWLRKELEGQMKGDMLNRYIEHQVSEMKRNSRPKTYVVT